MRSAPDSGEIRYSHLDSILITTGAGHARSDFISDKGNRMVVTLRRAANNTLEPLELKRLMEQAGEVGAPKRLASPAYEANHFHKHSRHTARVPPWYWNKND